MGLGSMQIGVGIGPSNVLLSHHAHSKHIFWSILVKVWIEIGRSGYIWRGVVVGYKTN